MICTNPECEKYGQETFRIIMVKGGETYNECGYCHAVIDLDKQPPAPPSGPYFKRGAWLKDWKLVNSGYHLDDMKFKPNLD